jgi:hypothetical protein
MVHVLVRILLLELGPLLIHVVIHLQLHNNVQDKTAPVIAALPANSTIDCPATPVFAVATAACGSAFTLTSADVTTNGSCAVRILLLELGPLLIHVIHLQLHKQLMYKIKRLQ